MLRAGRKATSRLHDTQDYRTLIHGHDDDTNVLFSKGFKSIVGACTILVLASYSIILRLLYLVFMAVSVTGYDHLSFTTHRMYYVSGVLQRPRHEFRNILEID